MGDRVKYSSRRSTDPYRSHRAHDYYDHDHHHHQHLQPQYAAAPEYPSRRRNTEPRSSNAGLTRVHSRPEDYKLPKTDKLFSYICFDEQGHPQDCDEVNPPETSQSKHTTQPPETQHRVPKPSCKGAHVETKAPLHRVDSYSSHEWIRTDDSGDEADSEDELTLPSMYHHDIGQKDDEWCARTPHRSQRADYSYRTGVHHEQPSTHRHSSSSPSPASPPSSSCVSPSTTRLASHANAPNEDEGQSSSHEEMLIAKVAQHLQTHKEAYGHNGTNQLVNELLGEVVRKVADGGLDPRLMKDVVREVQHAV